MLCDVLQMGNKLHSNVVADAVKRQAAGQTAIDQFINVKGGGELVELMKKATKTKNYDQVERCIREYNSGVTCVKLLMIWNVLLLFAEMMK